MQGSLAGVTRAQDLVATMTDRRMLFVGIETVSRELPSQILFAHHAMDRGWDVVLASRGRAWMCSEMIGRGVLIQTSGKRGERFPAHPDEFPGLRLLQYHQEGLVVRSDDELLARYPAELDFVDNVLVFGEYQRTTIDAARPEIGGRITAVGSPRFDLLDTHYRATLRSGGPLPGCPEGPFVLINTNFKAGNQSRLYRRPFEQRFARRDSEAWTLEDLELRRHAYTKLYDAYVDLVHELARTSADLPIVIRPHPSEDHDNWRKRLRGLDGVTVTSDRTAAEWIERASVVVHTGCTTGMEGRFLGRPVLRFNPIGEEVDEPDLPNRVSRDIHSARAVIDTVNASEGRAELSATERDVLRPYLINADGPISSRSILDLLDTFDVEPVGGQALSGIQRRLTSSPREAATHVYRAGQAVKRQFGRADARRAGAQKFPGLAPRDVVTTLRSLETIDARPAARVRRLGRDVVGLTRRT